MPDDERYSLTELADLAGVTPRTVRYYLAQGLLPAVGQTGPGSKYDDWTPRSAAGDPTAPGRAPATGGDPPPARDARRRGDSRARRRRRAPAPDRYGARVPAQRPRRTTKHPVVPLNDSRNRTRTRTLGRIAGRRSMSLPSVAPARDPIAEVLPDHSSRSARDGPGSGRGHGGNPRPARRPLPVGTDRARAGRRTPHQATAPADAEQTGRPPRDDRP